MQNSAAFITCAVLGAVALTATDDAQRFYSTTTRYAQMLLPFPTPAQKLRPATAFATALTQAAKAQIGVTVSYDPAYVGLAYPMGDTARSRGIGSDVVIRALRDAHDIDLQHLVHNDIKRAFNAYPKLWDRTLPDTNIDHRRVPNLETYFARHGMAQATSANPADFQPGDIVTWRLPGDRPHIGIISRSLSSAGTPLILHNIGNGAEASDILFHYPIVHHFHPTAAQFK